MWTATPNTPQPRNCEGDEADTFAARLVTKRVMATITPRSGATLSLLSCRPDRRRVRRPHEGVLAGELAAGRARHFERRGRRVERQPLHDGDEVEVHLTERLG